MCRQPVDDPHASGRPVTVADLAEDVSLVLNRARFYGSAHRSVADAIEGTLQTLKALRTEHGNAPIEIGCADGYLFHEQLPLLGAERATRRLEPLFQSTGSGGLSFGIGVGEEDLQALIALSQARDLESRDVEAANRSLQENGARDLRLLGAYGIGQGSRDFAARTIGTSVASNPSDGVPLHPHVVSVSERIYEGVFDHLTDVMMRIVRGDLFLVEETQGHVEEMLRQLNSESTNLLELSERRNARSDVFQFRHSIRAACLAIQFLRHATEDRALLLRAGAATLLHDVGKRFVPYEVLTCPGRLEGDALHQMQSHAEQGARWLLHVPDADPLAIAVAFGHHRTLGHSGYPTTRHRAEVSLVTRLVKICDVYEALTSERPYKDAMPPRRAYRIMISMGEHFDRALLHRFIRVIGIWPAGSRVHLESGAAARVLEQTDDLESPIVALEGEEGPIDLRTTQGRELGRIVGLASQEPDPIGRIRRDAKPGRRASPRLRVS